MTSKTGHEAERQLKIKAKKLQISKKAQTKCKKVVVDEDVIEVLDVNESLPRALRPQRQRQAPAYLHDYIT